MANIQSFLILLMVAVVGLTLAQDASNIESIDVAPVEKVAAAGPPTPAVASAPVAAAPVVSAPAVTPVTAPVAPAPLVDSSQGLSGTTTEHRNPDGTVITVTKFNGQLPQNAFHQHFPPMFSSYGSFGNPFYGFGAPLYPANPTYTKRSVRSVQEDSASSSSATGKKSLYEKRPRVSEKFHYPSPPPDYFSVHKRPFVPVIDNEFSDLL